MTDAVMFFLVRHAKAGDRERWTKPDDLRPLTKAGHEQAEALALGLAPLEGGIARIFSSRYRRCVQTVEPLARKLGLAIEESDALVEGASLGETIAFIERVATVPVAASTHGDVMDNLTTHLAGSGVRGADPALGKKGSVWALSVEGGTITSAAYIPPP